MNKLKGFWRMRRLATTRGSGSAPITGGRRKGENDNPYISARRTWNDHMQALIAARQGWQIVACLSLLVALAAVGGIAHVGSMSKFVPYVVEVDKLGEAAAVAPAMRAAPADPAVVHAAVAAFISDARLVTPDVQLQRKAVFRIYSMLGAEDAATMKMNEWLNGEKDSNPFKRAAKEMVSIEISSVIPQTGETWQVDWIEKVRDRQGVIKGAPEGVRWRALVTVYIVEPNEKTTEEEIRMNPLGVHVRDFSWSRQL